MKFDPAQLAFWLGDASELIEVEPKTNEILIVAVDRADDLSEYQITLPGGDVIGTIGAEGGAIGLNNALLTVLYAMGLKVAFYED